MSGDSDLRKRAEKRAKRKMSFRNSLVGYIIINAFLVGIWAFSGQGTFWPGFVLAAWGVGLCFQAWGAYGKGDGEPTDAQVEREMQHMAK